MLSLKKNLRSFNEHKQTIKKKTIVPVLDDKAWIVDSGATNYKAQRHDWSSTFQNSIPPRNKIKVQEK